MIVTLQTECIRTLVQVAAFVEANAPVDVQPADRASAHDFVARTLSRLGYRTLDQPSKGAGEALSGEDDRLLACPVSRA